MVVVPHPEPGHFCYKDILPSRLQSPAAGLGELLDVSLLCKDKRRVEFKMQTV